MLNADTLYEKGMEALNAVGSKSRDPEEAVRILADAAKAGHRDANAALAFLYFGGERGVEQSYEKALPYAEEAARQGCERSTHTSGVMHALGLGTAVDTDKGLNYFQTAAARCSYDGVGHFRDSIKSMMSHLYSNQRNMTYEQSEQLRHFISDVIEEFQDACPEMIMGIDLV